MADLDGGSPPGPVPGHLVARAAVQTLSVALVAVLFLGTWMTVTKESTVGQQRQTPVTSVAPADLTVYEQAGRRSAAAQSTPAAPIVLSYHDIGPAHDSSPYTVTPEAFESQMHMLHEAGYQTLSLEDLLRYRRGEFNPPPRSVLITFDDGTAGLWTYADPILERYGMRAVSFLITGSVGTRQPYYLTWDEIVRMQESHRWEFGSHTDNLHHRAAVNQRGERRGALTNRLWKAGRRETLAQQRTRVAKDLDRSIAAMVAHGLPRPAAFAFPFSETEDKHADRQGNHVVRSLLAQRFEITFVNANRATQPLSRRSNHELRVERAEVLSTDTDRSVFNRVLAMTTIPVTKTAPSFEPGDWYEPSRGAARVEEKARELRPAASLKDRNYLEADWLPSKTPDWIDYTVQADAHGLHEDRTVSVVVRVGGTPLRLRVSAHQAQVMHLGGEVIESAPVTSAATHRLRVDVADHATRFFVDGRQMCRVESDGSVGSHGGIGVVWSRRTAKVAFPTISDLEVSPLIH